MIDIGSQKFEPVFMGHAVVGPNIFILFLFCFCFFDKGLIATEFCISLRAQEDCIKGL